MKQYILFWQFKFICLRYSTRARFIDSRCKPRGRLSHIQHYNVIVIWEKSSTVKVHPLLLLTCVLESRIACGHHLQPMDFVVVALLVVPFFLPSFMCITVQQAPGFSVSLSLSQPEINRLDLPRDMTMSSCFCVVVIQPLLPSYAFLLHLSVIIISRFH